MPPISINCPWCKKDVALIWIALKDTSYGKYATEKIDSPIYYKTSNGNWSMGMCPNCQDCVLIKIEGNYIRQIVPHPMPEPTDKNIPGEIRKDIDEAKLCFSVGAYRACAVMCRRALQSACIEKGANKNKKLEDQIDEIAQKSIITNDLKDLAHSVRWVGNDAAHPEKEQVIKEDAEEILRLAEQFMGVVFVAPAKVNEIKERRNKNGNNNIVA